MNSSPKSQAKQQSKEQPAPFRTRLFRTWRATSSGPAAEVLVSLLPGGKAGLPTVSCISTPSPPSTPLPSAAAVSLPGTPTATGENFLQRRCVKTLNEAVEYTEKFKSCCRRRFGNLVQAWRELLDPKGVGRVGFVQFCEAARIMGFERVSVLWKVLDTEGSRFITLDIWDPPSYRALMEFRHICYREFGGLLEAFKYALDLDGSGTCRKPILAKFLDSFEYTGSVETLWNALDTSRGGFITAEELVFLLSWSGQRFTSTAMDRDFGFRHEKLRRAQERRRKERCKRQAELGRQKQESEAINSGRSSKQSQAPPPFSSEAIRQLVNCKHLASQDHAIAYSSQEDLEDMGLNASDMGFCQAGEPPSLSESFHFHTEEVSFQASFLAADTE